MSLENLNYPGNKYEMYIYKLHTNELDTDEINTPILTSTTVNANIVNTTDLFSINTTATTSINTPLINFTPILAPPFSTNFSYISWNMPNQLFSCTLGGTTLVSNIVLTRIGNIVFIALSDTIQIVCGGILRMNTLFPSQFRPAVNRTGEIIIWNNSAQITGRFSILSTGEFNIGEIGGTSSPSNFSPANNNGWPNCVISYIIS